MSTAPSLSQQENLALIRKQAQRVALRLIIALFTVLGISIFIGEVNKSTDKTRSALAAFDEKYGELRQWKGYPLSDFERIFVKKTLNGSIGEEFYDCIIASPKEKSDDIERLNERCERLSTKVVINRSAARDPRLAEAYFALLTASGFNVRQEFYAIGAMDIKEAIRVIVEQQDPLMFGYKQTGHGSEAYFDAE